MTRASVARAVSSEGPQPASSVPVVLTVLFFCSGALALIYEVLWQRRFALVLGAAAPATAAVLAAYFAGLGAGSLALGKAAARWPRPLRAYAVLEVLIGAGALAVVPLSTLFERMHPWLFERFAAHPGTLLAAKASLAFLCLAIPTFCMGGTLPVLAQLVDRGQRRLGIHAGLLYVFNTAGAGLGALCVPFVLLPAFGASVALRLCAAGNLALAFVAWQMDRRWEVPSPEAPEVATTSRTPDTRGEEKRREEARSPERIGPGMLATSAYSLVSGLVTFVLQVLWNRAFAQVHENSVYSFALIVAVFVFALAIGAQLARVGLGRAIEPEKLLGWAWVAGGALVALGPWVFLRMTDGLSYLPSDGGWDDYAKRLAFVAVIVVFPPVTLIGIGLPAIMERAGRSLGASAGVVLGRILAANVIGCVVGALLGGFLLPRTVGLWRAIELVALVLVAAGGWLLASTTTVQRRIRIALALGLGAVLWPLSVVDWPRVRVARSEGERLLALSEGTHGIVAVIERPASRRLKLNNYYILGGTAAAGDERMQAHIPLLLHPSPRKVAVLGLGTAITASGALFHPVDRLTAVELVPEVAAAARTYFRDANAGVLEDARTDVVVDDARSYLLGTSTAFDVIVGDLVVPWRPGEGALLTVEHFGAARRALAPGGLFCQWLPLFQLSDPELQILLRTFLSVFPRAEVWRGDFSPDQPALALVGSVEPFRLDPGHIERRLREMRADSFNLQLSNRRALWMYFVGEIGAADMPAGDTRINSEERPWVELMGPRYHGGRRANLLFTGRRLQGWLSEIRRRTTGRLRDLGAEETAGIEAGELLLEFSLLLAEGKEDAARSAQAQVRALLSKQAFEAIFPGSASAPAR